MICPICRNKTIITSTRTVYEGTVRQHKCPSCRNVFYSKETICTYNEYRRIYREVELQYKDKEVLS